MTLDMTQRYAKLAGLETEQVPDGYVVYLSARERVFFLNNTAAVILELCDGEHTLEEIAKILVAAYELDELPEEAFQTSVSNLIDEGLIAPCPA